MSHKLIRSLTILIAVMIGFFSFFGTTSAQSPVGNISGRVWLDSDDDGVYDQPLINAEISAQRSDTYEITQTNSEGDYEFINLAAGTWNVCVNVSEEVYRPDYDKDSFTDGCTVVIVEPDKTVYFVSFGYRYTREGELPLGTISGTVWYDTDKDGLQDSWEPVAPNLVVTFTTEEGDVLTMTTDSVGKWYYLSNYYHLINIAIEMPENYQPTLWRVGDDPTIDSDVFDWDGHNANFAVEVFPRHSDLDQGLGLIPVEKACVADETPCPQPLPTVSVIMSPESQWGTVGKDAAVQINIMNEDLDRSIIFDTISVTVSDGLSITSFSTADWTFPNPSAKSIGLSNMNVGLPGGAGITYELTAMYLVTQNQTIEFCLSAHDISGQKLDICSIASVNQHPTDLPEEEVPILNDTQLFIPSVKLAQTIQ